MNKQIQELADKAKKSVPHGLTPDKWIEVYNEKLAELIVRECDMVLSKDDGATHHSELLFTHFGVKE
jgi:predicted flavoprotein YhiN